MEMRVVLKGEEIIENEQLTFADLNIGKDDMLRCMFVDKYDS